MVKSSIMYEYEKRKILLRLLMLVVVEAMFDTNERLSLVIVSK